MYKAPSKIIVELREELEQLRLESHQNKEYSFTASLTPSKLDSIKQELQLKDQYIHDLEGDVKQLKAMGTAENIQYLRHTLVKFLCNSTKSEQTKLVPVVEQLLEMTYC